MWRGNTGFGEWLASLLRCKQQAGWVKQRKIVRRESPREGDWSCWCFLAVWSAGKPAVSAQGNHRWITRVVTRDRTNHSLKKHHMPTATHPLVSEETHRNLLLQRPVLVEDVVVFKARVSLCDGRVSGLLTYPSNQDVGAHAATLCRRKTTQHGMACGQGIIVNHYKSVESLSVGSTR